MLVERWSQAAIHNSTGSGFISRPCESQPRGYCLDRVMRYRLTCQQIQGQIAFVIQDKHGWHTTHRLDSKLPRNVMWTGNTGSEKDILLSTKGVIDAETCESHFSALGDAGYCEQFVNCRYYTIVLEVTFLSAFGMLFYDYSLYSSST